MSWYLAVAFLIGCGLSSASPIAEEELPSYGIVGGERADIKTLPYQVSLAKSGKHMCGGSIIADNIVLTATHCVIDEVTSTLEIRAGSNYHKEGGQLVKVSKVIQHEEFDRNTKNNDIAILILATPLKFGSGVQPISLPTEEIPVGKMAVVSGWGQLGEYKPASAYLQKVSANIFEPSQCKDIYRKRITPNMFCAGHMSGGMDSCQGDSGGPLAYGNTLIGIVSWGFGCGIEGLPGLYTYVLKFIPWIKSHVSI